MISKMILTAAEFERTSLGVHREIFEVHWASSFYCQPEDRFNFQPIEREHIQSHPTQSNLNHVGDLNRGIV